MRRFVRRVFVVGCSAVSLVLGAAAGVGWVRSYPAYDRISVRSRTWQFDIDSRRGTLAFELWDFERGRRDANAPIEWEWSRLPDEPIWHRPFLKDLTTYSVVLFDRESELSQLAIPYW